MSRRDKKLVTLAVRRLAPAPGVVELLEDMLRRAKAGEIRGVAVGIASDTRCTASAFAVGDGTIADLYLGIERAKLALLEHRE